MSKRSKSDKYSIVNVEKAIFKHLFHDYSKLFASLYLKTKNTNSLLVNVL